jgi:hypothetical protein
LLVPVLKKGFVGLTLAWLALAAPAIAQEQTPPEQAPPPSAGTPPEQAQAPENTPPAEGAPPPSADQEAPAPAPENTTEEQPRQRVQIRSVDTPLAVAPVEDPAPADEPVERSRGPAPAAHAIRSEPAVSGSAPTPAAPVAEAGLPAPAPERSPRAADRPSRATAPAESLPSRIVPRPVREIAEVVPTGAWAALAVLALLAVLFGASSWVAAMRARRLRRQRESLLQEVGLLQAALLPAVPAGLPVSVAYRPADDAAAGGDFYEAFALAGGRTGLVLGDMSGHGRDALARTTFVRYTLRAYLEAGLEPREVLKVGSAALAEHLDGGFATVTVAVYDSANGRFTYASAGHPPPVVSGGERFEPVIACSAPPIGIGEPTGFRQSTFTLTAGARACLYTDGVTEASVDGGLFGAARFEQALAALPPDEDADALLDSVVDMAEEITDDMAVCLVVAPTGAPTNGPRIEELEVSDEHEVGDSLERFLRACAVPLGDVPGVLREAGEAARREGSVTVRVRANDFRPGVDVVPGNLVRLPERRAEGIRPPG